MGSGGRESTFLPPPAGRDCVDLKPGRPMPGKRSARERELLGGAHRCSDSCPVADCALAAPEWPTSVVLSDAPLSGGAKMLASEARWDSSCTQSGVAIR